MKTHGLCRKNGKVRPEWAAWAGMRSRCENPKDPKYHRYGGRGIIVCDRWANDFSAFFHDVGERPSPKHSLGRIDNDGNYEQSNVQWETQSQQQNNRSNNRRLAYRGEEINLAEAARLSQVTHGAIILRIKKGWSVERAIETPDNCAFKPRILIKYNGEMLSIPDAAKLAGIKENTLRMRLQRGHNPTSAIETPIGVRTK